MSTPRERVLTAISHRQPDRVPFSWGFGPTPELRRVMNEYCAQQGVSFSKLYGQTEDCRYINAAYIGPQLPERSDVWGIVRKPVSYGGGAYDEVEHYPLAGVTSVKEIETNPWPDPDAYDYEGVREKALAADPDRKWAKKCIAGNPFEIYSWMTGFEEALTNVVLNPEIVVAALRRITDFFATRLRRTLDRCGDLVDIGFLADDLGGQTGLLMSCNTYRNILRPFHRELCETAKELAPHVKCMFHSDGAVFDILPDVIAAGVEILEAVQTDAAGMSPEALKTAYGDALAFHGGISVQQLLPHSDEETVETECWHVVAVFGCGGGYIAAPSHAIQMGTPPQNVIAMLRGVLGEADFQAAWDNSIA